MEDFANPVTYLSYGESYETSLTIHTYACTYSDFLNKSNFTGVHWPGLKFALQYTEYCLNCTAYVHRRNAGVSLVELKKECHYTNKCDIQHENLKIQILSSSKPS